MALLGHLFERPRAGEIGQSSSPAASTPLSGAGSLLVRYTTVLQTAKTAGLWSLQTRDPTQSNARLTLKL